VRTIVREQHGYTALIKACRNKHVQVAVFLIGHGASVNAKSQNGWTPLIEAARVGSVELVRLLLHQKQDLVDVNAKNNMGWTALMEACRTAHFSTVRCLIEEGDAQVDLRDHVSGCFVSKPALRCCVLFTICDESSCAYWLK